MQTETIAEQLAHHERVLFNAIEEAIGKFNKDTGCFIQNIELLYMGPHVNYLTVNFDTDFNNVRQG